MINAEDVNRKRLRYRSRHRGCKETDLLLGRFSDEKLAGLPPAQLAVYERLLEESDADIWNWLNGHPAPGEYGELLGMLKKGVAGC